MSINIGIPSNIERKLLIMTMYTQYTNAKSCKRGFSLLSSPIVSCTYLVYLDRRSIYLNSSEEMTLAPNNCSLHPPEDSDSMRPFLGTGWSLRYCRSVDKATSLCYCFDIFVSIASYRLPAASTLRLSANENIAGAHPLSRLWLRETDSFLKSRRRKCYERQPLCLVLVCRPKPQDK
jgi:hypothetical protein